MPRSYPPAKSQRGGKRPGAGRPRKSERCGCGKYTLRTAKVSRHKCPTERIPR